MKKFKSILALVLVLCLFVTLFAACAKTETPAKDDTPAKSDDKTPAKSDDKTDTPAPAADDEEEDEIPEETAELIFYVYDMRNASEYSEHVQDRINEIILDKINTQVEMHLVGPGDWANKVNLSLSSGERIDVMNLPPSTRVNTLYPQGLLTPLTELLPKYAPEAMEIVKDFIGIYTFDGDIYGLPTYRNYCKNGYILMNKQMLEEMGMLDFAQNIKSWSEYEEILKAVKENYTDKGAGIYGNGLSSIWADDYCCTGDAFSTYKPYDNLGDPLAMTWTDDDGNVSLVQRNPAYAYAMELNKKWFDLGYIWPDSELTSEFVDEIQKQKLIFSNICGSEYGVQVTKSGAYGYEVIAVNTVIGMVKTAQPLFTGICVPVTSEEPEAACRFINELYTNPEVMTLLVWGEEGVDYTIEDDQVKSAEGNHYLLVDFVIGNSTILKPLLGNGKDFYDKVLEINQTAVRSPYLGFSFNTGELSLEISQITAVKDQYAKSMTYGGYSEEKLAEYITKLEDAGIDKYLGECQTQLDAWRAANGK